MRKKCKVYVGCILLVEALGALTGYFLQSGIDYYNANVVKPPFAPPSALFPIVWTVLYALMGYGLARILREEPFEQKTKCVILFIIQLFLNLLWCFIFFGKQEFGLAFFVLVALWLAIWLMFFAWKEADKTAAYLQIPYLLWVTYAGYLNFMIRIFNP
ncbi:MAG: tryptophan-rich sensory protein [Lachnospiraceae bacterium]|nr:tryptophan-rich sensory protein [Lachnospiraceae bacterium]